ncbi:MAG: endonuclease III [Fimbriiglobus sp.]
MPKPKLPPAKLRVPLLLAELARLYPEHRTALDFRTPLELLVATILSAQCTDVRVNLVTPALFARYRTAAAFATADPAELEELVSSVNFFRNKAKNIRAACERIVTVHGGAVPATLEELAALPGVGRKTANVVLGDAFGIPGITVDTHVGRLSRRLGLTKHDDPVKVEHDLMKLVPQPEWTPFCHRVIYHGRQVCDARKPNCDGCTLAPLCPRVGVADQGTRDIGIADKGTRDKGQGTSKTKPKQPTGERP